VRAALFLLPELDSTGYRCRCGDCRDPRPYSAEGAILNPAAEPGGTRCSSRRGSLQLCVEAGSNGVLPAFGLRRSLAGRPERPDGPGYCPRGCQIENGTLDVGRIGTASITGTKIADEIIESLNLGDGAAVNRVIGSQAVSYGKRWFTVQLALGFPCNLIQQSHQAENPGYRYSAHRYHHTSAYEYHGGQ